jgi:hypothetical protein
MSCGRPCKSDVLENRDPRAESDREQYVRLERESCSRQKRRSLLAELVETRSERPISTNKTPGSGPEMAAPSRFRYVCSRNGASSELRDGSSAIFAGDTRRGWETPHRQKSVRIGPIERWDSGYTFWYIEDQGPHGRLRATARKDWNTCLASTWYGAMRVNNAPRHLVPHRVNVQLRGYPDSAHNFRLM